MKCPICKHGDTHPGNSSITLEREATTLVFRKVPAEVCDNCGEVFHSEQVTASLLRQADKIAAGGVELEVRPFEMAA